MKAETEGRIRQERENHDLIIENLRLQSTEFRKTILEGIALAGTTVGNGIMAFVSDREKLGNVAVTVTGIAFGIYTAKISLGVAGRFVESKLGEKE